MMQRRSVIQAIMTLAVAQGIMPEAEARAVALSIVAGEPEWLSFASNIADELDHRQGLRLLPTQGRGSLQALADLNQLQGADLAILTADTLTYAEAQGLLSPVQNRFSYVARLQSLPILLVTRTSIPSLTLLANKRLCTGPAQSAGFATGELVFGALGMPFVRVPKSHNEGLAAVLHGEADGALLIGTSALRSAGPLKDMQILPMPVPQGFDEVYEAHTLDQTDLPGLSDKSPKLETIATSLVLATSNLRRGDAKTAAMRILVSELFSSPSQVPWMTAAALEREVPGWKRNALAAEAAKTNP